MMTKVEIYQVRHDIDNHYELSFANYSKITKIVPNLKRDLKLYYDKKYEYTEDFKNNSNEAILEELYHKFNMNRPSDFKGHSLSISDIVILNESSMWYCDSYGWQEIE